MSEQRSESIPVEETRQTVNRLFGWNKLRHVAGGLVVATLTFIGAKEYHETAGPQSVVTTAAIGALTGTLMVEDDRRTRVRGRTLVSELRQSISHPPVSRSKNNIVPINSSVELPDSTHQPTPFRRRVPYHVFGPAIAGYSAGFTSPELPHSGLLGLDAAVLAAGTVFGIANIIYGEAIHNREHQELLGRIDSIASGAA